MKCYVCEKEVDELSYDWLCSDCKEQKDKLYEALKNYKKG